MEKAPGDIILFQLCTINEDHTIFASRDIRHEGQFFNLGHFLPFDPPNKPKSQNFEKMKKKTPGYIIIIHLSTTNDNHIMHGS